MSPAKSSIQSIDLDDLERKLRNFVDPRSPNVASGSNQSGDGAAGVKNVRIATANKPNSASGGQGLSSFGASPNALPATAKTTDLDAVEKQLREVAADVLRKPTPPSQKDDEALKNLSRLVGRSTRPEAAGSERTKKAQTSSVTPIERNSPRDIAEAYQGRAAKAAMKGASENAEAPKPREANPAPGANPQRDRASTPQLVRRFDHEARAFLAGAAARLDHMEHATAETEATPRASIVGQSVVSRSARSLALPLLLLALGTGSAIVMLSPVGEHPRGQMKDTQVQPPAANPGSGGGVSVSPALDMPTSVERAKLAPAKTDPPADIVKAAPASPKGTAAATSSPAPGSPVAATAAAPSSTTSASLAPVVSAKETKTASADLAPLSQPTTKTPAPPPAAPAPAANATAPAPAVVASDDAPPARAPASASVFSSPGAESSASASAPKAEDTPLTPLARTDAPGADLAQSVSPKEPAPSAPTADRTPAPVAQLPELGSAPAANAAPPRIDPTPDPATPAATAELSVANNPSPSAPQEATGAPARSSGTGDGTATSAQGEASHAAKPPSPNAPRTIELGKATNGVTGEGTPSAKTTSAAAPANEGAVATPSPAKTTGAALASKPILTRPAKPTALIATSHLPPVHATKPPPASSEPKSVDENNHVTGAVGAPLLITPPETSEPMLEANAAPADTPQAAEKPEKTIDAPLSSRNGPPFSLRLASSLSETDARATLSQLQKEFPGALQNGSVTRDNLGSYGVFYRVKVGPLPREAAEHLCSRLRAAGKKCVLTRG